MGHARNRARHLTASSTCPASVPPQRWPPPAHATRPYGSQRQPVPDPNQRRRAAQNGERIRGPAVSYPATTASDVSEVHVRFNVLVEDISDDSDHLSMISPDPAFPQTERLYEKQNAIARSWFELLPQVLPGAFVLGSSPLL